MDFSRMMVRTIAGASFAVASLAFAGSAGPAVSAPNYDGLWSVVIITDKGSCDRAYRYPVRISKGTMLNAGESPVTIIGNVGTNGAVAVKVTYGAKSASGSGRLAGSIGAGSWKGGECSGTWEAERRGA